MHSISTIGTDLIQLELIGHALANEFRKNFPAWIKRGFDEAARFNGVPVQRSYMRDNAERLISCQCGEPNAITEVVDLYSDGF